MALTNTAKMRDEVDEKLRHYIDGIKVRTKCNLNDEAVDAEGFFRNFLNLIYGFNLSKDKIESAHNETIDLHCIKQKICVQVSAQNSKQKVNRTINHFLKKERFHLYKKLYFLILDRDKKFTFDTNKLSDYGVSIIFLDYSTIFKKLVIDFDNFDKMSAVHDFVMKDLDKEYANNIREAKQNNLNYYKTKDELKNKHIVDQIYQVLQGFEEFRLIHPRTLSKLYPFNLEKRSYDTYSNYCLKTNNKAIHELLQKVKISENHEIVISDKKLQPYSDKLKKIFTKLNHSLISCICYREKYTEIEHHKISVIKNNRDCDCIQCQYQKFNTQSLFALLKEKSIKHSDELCEALWEGYYLCKLGEHIKGWQVFNSIAEKSKAQKKHITYFITQHNILAIYNFIASPWWENEAKAIIPKIEEIDLHNTLCGVDVPLAVRDELIRVKEDYHLNYSRELIEEYAEKIHKVKTLYEGNGFSSGSVSHVSLRQEMHLFFAYYTVNGIIADDFFTFKATITKAVEAFFISYTTDNRYEHKYKAFDSFILSMMLFYVEEDTLLGIFKTHRVEEIEIAEGEKKKFINEMANFFTSQFTIGTWSDAKFYADIKNQPYFSHYRQLLRHLFNRAMLILSKVNLTKEELKPITEPFTTFLKAAEDFNHKSWEYIADFLEEHIQAFDEQQIKTIIELIFFEKKHRNGDSSLHQICQSAYKKAQFNTLDKQFILKAFNLVSDESSSRNPIHGMAEFLALWCVADENGKELIKQKAVEYLEKSFDEDFYQLAAFSGIFHKDEHTNFLEQYITYAQNSCHQFDLKEESGHWVIQNYTGFNCINCLICLNVDFSKENLQVIAQKSDYYNWLVNYEKYDYSKFNVNWLIEACPYRLKSKLHKIQPLKDKVAKELSKKYNADLASFFFKYLSKS